MKTTSEPLLKIEVKDAYKTIYKAKVISSNKKGLTEIFRTLTNFGFMVIEACGSMIKDEKTTWFED